MYNRLEIGQANRYLYRIIGNSLLVMILFFSYSDMNAQEININHIDLFVKDNVLFTRLHIRNFFDENMNESIASGMSRKFNFQFELYKTDQKRIFNHIETISLKYDVWERIYLLNTEEEEKQFNNIEKFVFFFSDSTIFNLGNINNINPNDRLQLFIIFSQQKMSERQQNELKSWIAQDAKTSESQPALETNQSFSINISKLLSLFFSREDIADLYIYKSPSFTLKSLDENENTPQ